MSFDQERLNWISYKTEWLCNTNSERCSSCVCVYRQKYVRRILATGFRYWHIIPIPAHPSIKATAQMLWLPGRSIKSLSPEVERAGGTLVVLLWRSSWRRFTLNRGAAEPRHQVLFSPSFLRVRPAEGPPQELPESRVHQCPLARQKVVSLSCTHQLHPSLNRTTWHKNAPVLRQTPPSGGLNLHTAIRFASGRRLPAIRLVNAHAVVCIQQCDWLDFHTSQAEMRSYYTLFSSWQRVRCCLRSLLVEEYIFSTFHVPSEHATVSGFNFDFSMSKVWWVI